MAVARMRVTVVVSAAGLLREFSMVSIERYKIVYDRADGREKHPGPGKEMEDKSGI